MCYLVYNILKVVWSTFEELQDGPAEEDGQEDGGGGEHRQALGMFLEKSVIQRRK